MRNIFNFKIISLFFSITIGLNLSPCRAEETLERIFVCKNPDFSNKYWIYLNKKRPLNQEINYEYINHIYSFLLHDKGQNSDPQKDKCIWIKAKELTFFASDSSGALAITDGVHDIWFKNKASFGWINSQFYIFFKRKKI